ncbi:hypothetical protein [Halobaculum sp. D14]|uniref:hypothetical protein n=1 Tax=Halobaculum sp. D14 TaxID=3421642 RepID=UPI003EB7E32E
MKYEEAVLAAVSYVVEVKPSARKANGAVGRAVVDAGVRRAFGDRDDAEAWAASLSDAGARPVWIHAAHPADRSDVDAYLVSRQRQLLDLDGAYDKRRRRLRGDTDEPGTLSPYIDDS